MFVPNNFFSTTGRKWIKLPRGEEVLFFPADRIVSITTNKTRTEATILLEGGSENPVTITVSGEKAITSLEDVLFGEDAKWA